MASPLAEGLFNRAIAQSGWFGDRTPSLDDDRGTQRSAHRTGLDLAQRLEVEVEGVGALAALRARCVDELLSVPVAIGSITSGGAGRALRFAPNVDGWVLPRQPGEVWAKGEMHRVPFLAGSLLDDGSVFSRKSPIRGLTGYRLALRAIFGAEHEQALALFPAADDAAVPAAVHRVTTLLAFRAPARRLARWVTAAGGDAWLFHFSHLPERRVPGREGVFHGVEVPYVFGTLGPLAGATDRAVSADVQRRWIDFARHGDPNGAASGEPPSPPWPKHERETDQHLEIGDRSRVGTGLDREACDLLDAVAARRLR
jgi:para-nitrobenzyl esterase